MSASIIAAILALLAALAPLVAGYFQKRLDSTPADQARAQREADINELTTRIAECERAGDLAGADVLRKRLRELSGVEAERDADAGG